MITRHDAQYFKLITLNKKALIENIFNRDIFLDRLKYNFNIDFLIESSKKIRSKNKNIHFKRNKDEISLKMFTKNKVNRVIWNTRTKNIKFSKLTDFINNKATHKYKTDVCSDRKCRSLELQYKTKINEFSLIGKEERVKIDNLLRKEIVKIYENKLEKKKMPDIKDSFKNNENLDKNSNNFNLSNSTKVINRKLIIATNSILNLLEDLFN